MRARMLSQAETENVKKFTYINCKNCPYKDGCKEKDFSFGCELVNNHKWEVIYFYRTDSKYGRAAINYEKKWRRGVTFDEFYGGGVVD